MKKVSFSHGAKPVEVKTQANVLTALLASSVPVKMACGGRGICATCHVYIEKGADCVTPITTREERTLNLLAEREPSSRLSCQAKVLREGVVVRLPPGLYVERFSDLNAFIGRRAEERVLHPIDGRVLVPVGKIITRSVIERLNSLDADVARILDSTSTA